MKIKCARKICRNTLETPPMSPERFEQLLTEQRWSHRGTGHGFRYYCPTHSTDDSGARLPTQRRGPRVNSACPPGCKGSPLFDALGHDEIGHRTARRLLSHLHQEATGIRSADEIEAYDSSDAPLEALLEMTREDFRRIWGIGENSLNRLTAVLGRID